MSYKFTRTAKNILSSISILAIVLGSVPAFPNFAEAATATIFEDGFETQDFTNWTYVDEGNAAWDAIGGGGSGSSDKKARVSGESTNVLLTKAVSTVGHQNIEVSFDHKDAGLETGDYVVVEYSPDGGSNWVEIETFDENNDVDDNSSNAWVSFSDTLGSDANNNSDFQLRFRASLDANSDSFDLDGFDVEGEEIAPTTPVEEYFNGFESDTVDWTNNGGTTTRTPDGTDGVPSQCGDYHAVIDGPVYTKWGGYADEFPVGGYTTEVDVYLDTSLSDGSPDKGFDFSSAVNGTDGNHRRDFIFHLETDSANPGAWLVNASNNAPGNPSADGDSVAITETGWYTLQADFHDNGSGVLEVTMNVIKRSDNSVIFSEDRSDPSDVIGTTVGGNRYGWFTSHRFDLEELAIDNAALYLGGPEERVCTGDSADSETIVVSGNTSAGENQPGWLFNRDVKTATPFLFDEEESQIGTGALHVLPIANDYDGSLGTCKGGADQTGCDKFIAEYFPSTTMGVLESFSYDFNIGAGGDASDENEFYLSVYTNFGDSTNPTTNFYDCRYSVVPTTGVVGSWTTVTFDPNASYSVAKWSGSTSPHVCPATPADMGADAVVRAFAINLGDTSNNDTGLDGYFDNVVKIIDEGSNDHTTIYDFEPEQTATVEICKFNEDDDRLSGWTLMLLGNHVETVNVPSTGTEVFSTNSLDGNYAFVANGTYTYRPGYSGSVTDAAFSMRTAGNDPIDPTGHPYNPWVRVNDFASPYAGYLGITVDNAVGSTDWGSVFNSLHEYSLQYNGDGDAAGFKMLDSSYGDNSGSLTVDIYEGFSGVTEKDGCVTFEDVPYGDYEIDEIMQDGWFNVSGLGEVTVNEEQVTFNVVNTDEEPQPTSTVQICKIDESQNVLSGWSLMLLGDEVDDLQVPANTMAGVDSTPLEGGMSYLAHVSGTWLNDRNPDNHVDAEYSTEDGWVTHMNGFTGYGENILELQVAESFMDWGDYNEDHEYTASFIPNTDGAVNFRIFDGNDPTPEAGWYGDNSGSLDVTIEEGYVDVTGENGCVTFENVPYGTYEIDEIMQDGWSNLSGLGEVVVDGVTEVFTVVNQTPEPAQMCSVTVVSDDTNVVEETDLNAVETWAHVAWTAVIDSADWIWGSEYVTNPAVTEVQTFVKEFEWSGGIASSSLVIATDNYYEVYLNGDFVASSTEASLFKDENKDTIDVSSFIDVGNNTLEIKVTNLGVPGSTAKSNPAGLKYNLTVVSNETGEDCMYAPEEVDPNLEITNPATDYELLFGEHTFEAEYTDDDETEDTIHWAIKVGTCTGNSPEINVAGFGTDGYSPASYNYTTGHIEVTVDMSDWEEDDYCFVVNPQETGGETDTDREIRWFTLENPEPTQCLIVSDTNTIVVENNDYAVETWDGHSNWTHAIADAIWIWDSFEVVDPEVDTTRTFKETFNITGLEEAKFYIAADNTYSVYINDVLAYEHLNVNNYQTHDEYTDVANYLVEGENELVVEVTNIGTEDSIAKSNPAGALFKLKMEVSGDGGQCVSTTEPEDEPLTFTLDGYKWNDENGDGEWGEGEDAIAGWTIYAQNGEVLSTTTDADGYYFFEVEEDNWEVYEATSTSWTQTGTVIETDYEGDGYIDAGSCIFVINKESESPFSTLQCNFGNNENPVITVASTGGGGGGETSYAGTGYYGRGGGDTTLGRVLGASTDTCEQYLTETITPGRNNNPAEVIRLQEFLNSFEGYNLELTGVYDVATQNAVGNFQEKYDDNVLAPWGLDSRTLNVYYTTRKTVNEIYCKWAVAFPLSQTEQSEIDWFRGLGLAYRQNGGNSAATPTSNEGNNNGGENGQASDQSDDNTETANQEDSNGNSQAANAISGNGGFFAGIWNWFMGLFSN